MCISNQREYLRNALCITFLAIGQIKGNHRGATAMKKSAKSYILNWV